MKYSKIQKIISYILLFAFFINISVNIPPIFSLVLAKESSFYNLVSIIVDEKTYAEIKFELERYSKDISNVLENTKVVIIPVPKDASPFTIASMNEAMFFDGYKELASVDFESKLISTVFVGDIPLPVVYKSNEQTRTVLPYVDFENKSFVYNKEKNRYEENISGNYEIKPEVEFGFISPNTGSFEENIKSLKNYFSKNHDFYVGAGLYEKLNGKKEEVNDGNHRPYVFYYDYFREKNGFNPGVFSSYLATRQKNEDLAYQRYSKELFKFLSDASKSTSTKDLLVSAEQLGLKIPETTSLGNEQIYDIQARIPIEKLKKNFINSFSTGTLGELRKDVFNAGRYNFGQNVNVDFLPHIISEIDLETDKILKKWNETLENKVDTFVEQISRKIAVPSSVTYYPTRDGRLTGEFERYENYFFGKNSKNISKAEECSFYRGSKQFVEANRGLNISNLEGDVSKIESMGIHCLDDLSGSSPGTNGLWGKNTPLYLDKNFSKSELKLKSGNDVLGAIEPLFDVNGSVLKEKGDKIANVNPLQCFDSNYLLDEKVELVNKFLRKDSELVLETVYKLKGKNWTCKTDNNLGKTFSFNYNHIEDNITQFNDTRNGTTCDISVYLDGTLVRELKNPAYPKRRSLGEGDFEIIYNCKMRYDYKSVDSVVKHKEPLPTTVSSQAENMITPNLPIDSPRYVDFIRADGKYIKINYPNVFAIKGGKNYDSSNNIFSELYRTSALSGVLGEYHKNLNNILKQQENKDEHEKAISNHKNYGKLLDLTEPKDKKVEEKLLKRKYEVDKIFEDYILKNFDLVGDQDLSFSIMWNGLSISEKYSYIFEKYLSNDKEGKVTSYTNIFKKNIRDNENLTVNNLSQVFPLIKEEYEIAYIGAEGNSQNMMIRFDPEQKNTNPYADIISKNQELSAKIFGNSLSTGLFTLSTENNFSKSAFGKCAPPDGVILPDWPKAVECRMKDLLPAKITISESTCSDYSVLKYAENKIQKYEEEKLEKEKNPFKISSSEANSCSVDNDKDGISDCLQGLDSIKISSDSSSYAYNRFISLVGSFYQKEDKATFVNNTPITFEIIKLEKAKDEEKELSITNLEVVYDIEKNGLNDEKNLLEYISFNQKNNSIASLGEAVYGFNSGNKDLNVYLKAKSNIGNKTLSSEILKIEIRENSLNTFSGKFVKSKNILSNSINSVKANDKTNVYIFDLQDKNFEDFKEKFLEISESEENLFIGVSDFSKSNKTKTLNFPLKIELSKNGQVVQDLEVKNRQDFISLSALSNSGTYNLKIVDKNGFSVNREFYILPEEAFEVDLRLGSNVMLSDGSITTNIFTIFDKFKNPVTGKNYLAELEIGGKNFVFLDENTENKKMILDIFEGFALFRLKSLGNIGEENFTIKILDKDTKKVLITKTEKIKSIKNAKISMEKTNFSLNSNQEKFKISLLDDSGKLLSSVNSRVYFTGNENYFSTSKNYFEMKNGVAEIEIFTKTLAGGEIPVEIQVEGFSKIFNEKISINPAEAVKVDVLVQKPKMSTGSSTEVYLELKDKFNNTVITDSTSKGKISFDLYNHIISGPSEVSFKNGKAVFEVTSKNNPGTGYFKVEVPGLSEKIFEIKDENETLKVNGISENIGKIETYYFWNKEKLEKQNYNSLYSVLLGAGYGDISVQDYLAGNLIFDRKSKALAVTTLIEDGNLKNGVLALEKNGNLKNIFSKRDLSQTIDKIIGIEDGKLFLNLYNKSLNIGIGKIFFNINKNNLEVCNNLENCFDKNNTTIAGISTGDYNFYKDSGKLILKNNSGEEILTVSESGIFEKKSDFIFEINENNSGNHLDLIIKRRNETIGNIFINLKDFEFNSSSDNSVFNLKKQNSPNSILIRFDTNQYFGYKNLDSYIISYNDIFASNSSLDSFAKMNISGFENFKNNAGLGWKDENKTLLSFSAGKNVGASVKDFMGFYTINIGDPFISLKAQKRLGKQFNSTIGEILLSDEDVVDYKVFDYNADGRKDILLRKRDNYLELLENKNTKEKFLNKGNLAQVYDLGINYEVGDFTGDGFEDVFFVGRDGNPYVLNNVSKDFTRIDLTNKLNLGAKISQVSVFDMDNDGKSDLVTLDESGNLNIFYGGGNSANPSFTAKKIGDGLGLKLNSGEKINGGAIYFSGLHQPSADVVGNSGVDSRVIDSEIYVNFPYSKNSGNSELSLENYNQISSEMENTSFLKSEYFSSAGIEYKKIYKDRNSGVLASGDIIDVEIKIKNISGKNISNILLLEKFDSYFNIDGKSIKNSKNLEIFGGIGNYDFSFRNFSLALGEELTINYSGTSKTLSHLKIKTGLFEKGEIGDDKFGDILVDDLNLSCGKPVSVYKSVSARDYQKGQAEGKCDMSELPAEIKQISTDEDKNGTPDYLDELQKPENLEDLQEYSKKELKNLEKSLNEAEDLLNGLSCGFSNGACISTPLNWAPLAPGSDPTFMGNAIGDGLKVDEGIPIFSALTGRPTKVGCIPSVWPGSPLALESCTTKGAGGALGVNSSANMFRIFVTPTLTGGVGTAICMGGPASVVGRVSNPMGIAPLFPGGNCIVLAKPLLGCSNDGSEGDPSSVGVPNNYNYFSVINAGSRNSSDKHGTCKVPNITSNLETSYVKSYLASNGGKTDPKILGIGVFKNALENHSKYDGTPMFNIDLGGDTGISVGLVPAGSSDDKVDFSDVEQITKQRISSFPEFLMNWFYEQIEEIVSKLTDFPTLFIVLPDFDGIYDSDKSWQENWKAWEENENNSGYNVLESNARPFAFSDSNSNLQNTGNYLNEKRKSVNSGVREAYEFIATLPLVNLEQEVVNVSVPWVSDIEVDRAIKSWTETIEDREKELERFSTREGISDELKNKTNIEVRGLIGSVKKNIEIIKEYKQTPEKIKELLRKKEDYLYQVLCNIEIISDLIGGWIGENGERFKSWVELYILIKAVLKSWQALIDIFVGFEQECKECKNERGDLMNYQFKLINMISPKFPIVRFPKWPDIILDLHHIRASINVSLPEFEINTRPVVLPNLPSLNLPSAPNVNGNLSLPDIKILPELKIPTLPDLPSLPKIDLPDLPPPPKLPKLFTGFDVMFNVAKYITKALCILKISPFHPEWRAGDQIAFLTERNGYMSFDFFSKNLPQYSVPFIDAIEITSYVNMEFSTDFIVELANEIVKPINSFTSDFTNSFRVPDVGLDFRGAVPESIDANAEVKKTSFSSDDNLVTVVPKLLSEYISKGIKYTEENKNELVSNAEFRKLVANALSNPNVVSSPAFDEIRETWKQVDNYSFAGENELIKSLQKYNYEKFETIKNIIETERFKNKNLQKELENTFSTGIIKVSKNENSISRYKEEVSKFNKITFENIGKVVNFDEKNSGVSEIKNLGNNLQDRAKEVFVRDYENDGKTALDYYKNSLLAVNNSTKTTHNGGSCSVSSNGYKYNYYGIYILEEKKSYRLFDYVDEVQGGETTTPIDFDLDGDEDLLYFINNTLYLKENFSKKDTKKVYLNEKASVLEISENKFLKKNFIESVNNAEESVVSNSMVNINFSSLKNIYNYRLSYFNIIDKFSNPNRDEVDNIKNKNIVDGIASAEDVTKVEENNFFIKRKDVVSISRIGNFKGFKMETIKIQGIKEDLLLGKTVTISSGKKLHSGNNILDIIYKVDGVETEQKLRIEPNRNLEFKQDITIVGITTGNGYIETDEEVTYNGDEISKLKGLPIPFGTKIYFTGDKNNLQNNSYFDLQYYDNSEFRIDFNKIYSWELYDLGLESSEYLFTFSKNNDYYYSKINGFKNSIIGTSTGQILLSPQLKADKNTPEISLNSVKVPVYQEVEIDITDKVTEDSGVDGIGKIFVDFFLEVDTNGDGNYKNDDNSLPNLKIFKKENRIFLKLGKFTSLQKKKIGINVFDSNGNYGFKEISFEVYSPIPEIESYDGVTISGKISENLKEEPINFYRFRAGNLTKLSDEENNSLIYTNEKGEFSLKTGKFESGLTIKDKSGKQIASISEKTGKISINPVNKQQYNLSVKIEDSTNFPQISILENGKNIFKQILRVTGSSKVSLVENFDNLDKNGIYVKNKNSEFGYYVLPENIINNPGVFVGYKKSDKYQNPILKIYPDGRLELPKNYKLNYKEFKDYIVLEIIDDSGKNIFEILYKIDADYVIN